MEFLRTYLKKRKLTLALKFLLVFVVFVQFNSDSQVYIETSETIDPSYKSMGYRKKIPELYQPIFNQVLSYYPELDSIRIIVKEAKISSSLNARPTPFSLLFRRRENRKYKIRINVKKGDSLALFSEATIKAQIGVLGHELAHIVDYNHRSLGGVFKRLFSYTTIKGKEKYEKEIDSMAVHAGLGEELHAWSSYVLNESNATKLYKEYKRKVYLEPEEIEIILREIN